MAHPEYNAGDVEVDWAIDSRIRRLQERARAQRALILACQLRKDGTAFQVAGNIAIEQKKAKTVTCDAAELVIYSQKDGGWVNQDLEKMKEILVT